MNTGKKVSGILADEIIDKKLKIHTTGRDDSRADEHHHPYEPTPYSVLKRLAESGYINSDSKVIDYGCGKGRVGFFLNHELGCHIIGVDYDDQMYLVAGENQKTYGKNQNVKFVCAKAEEFQVEDADSFYFFNPFSVEILKAVLAQITESYYEDPRDMLLFFYYPSDEYLAYLMTVPELSFLDEVDCRDLFEGNDARERIMIFEITTFY